MTAVEQKKRGYRLAGYLLLALVVYRLLYHLTYLADVPFALSTFSDGALYEQAAFDIYDNPPWGTEVFYLQGAYAYLLALGLWVRPWISMGLVLQILLGLGSLYVFARAAKSMWGPTRGRVSTICLLAYPALAFYENKYLSAELGIVTNIFVFAAVVWMVRMYAHPPGRYTWRTWLPAAVLGLATAGSILARTNMLLCLPFVLWAAHGLGGDHRVRRLAALCLGIGLGLAPMAYRNFVVTGHPDLGPAHGGGTSFYIGNNPDSKGTWNAVGGLLTGEVAAEREELALALDQERSDSSGRGDPDGRTLAGADRAQSRAIGKEMYRRGFRYLREQPLDAGQLMVAKVFRSTGNAEMAQDYDWAGERELLAWSPRIGLPFGILLFLAVLGLAWPGRGRDGDSSGERSGEAGSPTPSAYPGGLAAGERRIVAIVLLGQAVAVLAALLAYFTSAQHRLPLCVILAVWSGPGVLVLIDALKRRVIPRRSQFALATALLVQACVPRPGTRSAPHAVHYYNLAIVQKDTGDLLGSLGSLDRALALAPDQPSFLLRRAQLLRYLSELDRAEADLARILALDAPPEGIARGAENELALIANDRAMIEDGRLIPRTLGPAAGGRR